MTSPLRITDALLFNCLYSLNARVVCAAMAGAPSRGLSLTDIAATTGLKRHTVEEALNELEATADRPYHHASGRIIWPQKQLASLDRPEHWYDRNPQNQRFNRTNRLDAVDAEHDDLEPENRRYLAELPAPIVARLESGKGKKNAALVRLVALAYVGEQLQRGAIHADDATLAYRLDPFCSAVRVKRARTELLNLGVIVPVEGREGAYTMPGGTPGKPEDPARLDESKTLRRYTICFGDGSFLDDVFASTAAWDEIQRLSTRLGEDAADEALWRAEKAGRLSNQHLKAPAVIAELQRALDLAEWLASLTGTRAERAYALAADRDFDEELHALRIEHQEGLRAQEIRKRHLSTSQETPIDVARDTGRALPTTDLPKPSSAREDLYDQGESSATTGDGEERAARTKKPGRPRPSRREYGRSWFGVFCFADENTHAHLLRFRDALEAKYGHSEAANEWRTIFLKHGRKSKGNGRKILEELREQYRHLDPDAVTNTEFLDALLGNDDALADEST